MLKQLIVLCAIGSAVLCRHAPSNLNTLYSEQNSEKIMGSDDKGDDSFMANWDISSIYNSVKNYTNSDISVYLKMKFLEGIDSATRDDLDLGGGIRLVRDNSKDVDASDNEKVDMRSLPRGLGEKEDALTSMIWKKINRLLRTHTMQVKFPLTEESREKNKKNGALIMIPLLLAGTFIPIAYGALALLAGKALIVSKLALVLASIIGIKKLVSGSSGHHESSHEVVVSGGHGNGGWGRNMDRAYKAHVPHDTA